MKLALLTYWTNDRERYDDVAAINVPARDTYCARHGYTHVTHCGPYHDATLYYAVARIFKVYDMLFNDPNPPDYVWVLNVQAVITNQTIAVDTYLTDDADFWITRDCHVINAGSLIVRRSEWSRQWLQMIMKEAPVVNHCWHENFTILTRAPESPWKERINVLPQDTINSYSYSQPRRLYPPWGVGQPGDWKPGHLVLSLPGLNINQRLDIIRSVQPLIIT